MLNRRYRRLITAVCICGSLTGFRGLGLPTPGHLRLVRTGIRLFKWGNGPDVILPDKITLVSILCLNQTKPAELKLQMAQIQVLLKTLLFTEREYLRRIIPLQDNVTAPLDIPEGYKALEFILISDNKSNYEQVQDYLELEMNSEYSKLIKLVYIPAVYPKGYEHLMPMYAPCATLRLFIDQLLPEQEEFVYLDTDILFLKSVREIYNQFSTFNETQWAGMGPDWYTMHMQFVPADLQYPYYGSQGLNAGLGIYNLTRLRRSNFSESIGTILEKYNKSIVFADQDVLNIYFSSHPDEVNELSCRNNFLMVNCRLENRCNATSQTGVTALHGAGHAFRVPTTATWWEPVFPATFQFFEGLNLKDLVQDFEEVQMRLREALSEEQKVAPAAKKPQGTCQMAMKFADTLLGKLNYTTPATTILPSDASSLDNTPE